MRKFIPMMAVIVLLALPLPAPAATGEEERAIQHLIEYVNVSPTTFIRDGIAYSGPEAADHLAMKYRYVRTRVDTADDFITFIGSRSSLSNIPYRIRTETGREVSADAWLRAELQRFRVREASFAR